ncbi:hypothetical protein EDC01DRAFT_636234 [Geopyxis carbonaria]|nr:hypothetical protein EDC01DRAFT_636234 [Geopyxis carbonaria]
MSDDDIGIAPPVDIENAPPVDIENAPPVDIENTSPVLNVDPLSRLSAQLPENVCYLESAGIECVPASDPEHVPDSTLEYDPAPPLPPPPVDPASWMVEVSGTKVHRDWRWQLSRRKNLLAIGVLAVLVVAALIIAIYFGVRAKNNADRGSSSSPATPTATATPTNEPLPGLTTSFNNYMRSMAYFHRAINTTKITWRTCYSDLSAKSFTSGCTAATALQNLTDVAPTTPLTAIDNSANQAVFYFTPSGVLRGTDLVTNETYTVAPAARLHPATTLASYTDPNGLTFWLYYQAHDGFLRKLQVPDFGKPATSTVLTAIGSVPAGAHIAPIPGALVMLVAAQGKFHLAVHDMELNRTIALRPEKTYNSGALAVTCMQPLPEIHCYVAGEQPGSDESVVHYWFSFGAWGTSEAVNIETLRGSGVVLQDRRAPLGSVAWLEDDSKDTEKHLVYWPQGERDGIVRDLIDSQKFFNGTRLGNVVDVNVKTKQ